MWAERKPKTVSAGEKEQQKEEKEFRKYENKIKKSSVKLFSWSVAVKAAAVCGLNC